MTGVLADKWTLLLLRSSSVPAGLRGGTCRRLRGAPLIAAAPATRRMAAVRSCPAGTPPRCGTGRHRNVTRDVIRRVHLPMPHPSGQPPTPFSAAACDTAAAAWPWPGQLHRCIGNGSASSSAPVGQRKGVGALHQLVLVELVLHHELCQVAHHLAAGRHLHRG